MRIIWVWFFNEFCATSESLLILFFENIEQDNPACECVCKGIIGSEWALEDNPDRIYDADEIEIVAPTTWDKGGILNPASGVKIFPIHHVSNETLKQKVERERKEYFDAVAREFAKSNRIMNWLRNYSSNA